MSYEDTRKKLYSDIGLKAPSAAEKQEKASANVQSWLEAYNSAVNGFNEYADKTGDKWDAEYGGKWYQDILGVLDQYDSVRTDFELLSYDKDTFNPAIAYYDLKNLSDSIRQRRDSMSQFDSDESYNTAMKQVGWYQKYQNLDYNRLEEAAAGIEDAEEQEFVQSMAANARIQRLLNMDTTMAQTDLGQLRRERDQLYDLALESVDWTDGASRQQPDQIKDEYDSRIAKLETEIATAKRYQKEAEMSGVSDRNSQNYDPEFAQRAQFRGDSELSRFINEGSGISENRRNTQYIPNEYLNKNYDRLTQEEKDIYNYWDSYDQQNGTNKAQEYLDSMQDKLNARQATGIYERGKDYNRFLKMLAYGMVGMEGAFKGMSNLDKLFSGSEEYTPASATQIAANMLLQDDRENGHKIGGLGKYSPANLLQDEEGGRTWEEFAGQNAMSMGNMVPSMATGLALNLALPGLGVGAKATEQIARAGSLAVMGAGIAGNTYTEAINQGYSPSNAKAYAYANAASEIGTELLFGGIEGMTGIGTDALGEALLKKTDSAIMRGLTRGVVDGFGETLEEGVQAVIEPWMNNVILHKDEVLRGQDVAYSMLAGFATGALMSSPTIALDEYGTYRTGKDALNQNIDVDTLRGIGESFDAGTEANRLAQKIDKNTGAYTIGRVLNEIGAGLGEQNVRDISRYLQNHGLPAEVAEQNAMVLNYIAMGGQLSEQEITTVNENAMLADAFREVVLNQDSRVHQRTKGFRQIIDGMNGKDSGNADTASKPESRRNQNGDAAMKSENRAVLAVVSREGDTMQLRMKDGSIVDSTVASYKNSDEALLFDTARKFSVDDADANRIANGFEGSNVTMQEYCKGVEDSYRYGLYGMNYSEVKRGSMSSSIDAEAAHSAYLAGIREANTRVAQHQKAAMEARKPGQEASLHFDRNRRTFDAKRETAISTMEQLSKALGVDFWVFESYEKNGSRVYADETGAEHKAPNGWYDENGIHIDLNAGNDGRGVMLYTLAHELTHHIRKYSPEKFKAFADVVMKGYGDRGMSAESLIQEQIAKAKRSGRDIDYDTAYEELIADSMEGILSDGKVLEKLKSLQESDPSLWETVKQWAKDTAEKIRKLVDAYKGQRMDSTEGKMVSNMKEILPQLEELYAEGLADTRGTVDTGATEHTTGIEGTDVNNVQYSIRNDIVDENGVEYDNVVMLDKPIPKRILSDQKTFAKFLVNELFNKKISVLDQNGDVEVIEFAGEKERVSKGGKPRLVRGELTRATGDVRKIIIANLEEVAERSAYDPINSSNDSSHGWLDQNGWESRKTYVTDGDTVYEAYLKIGKARDGRNILYALNCDVKKGIAVDKSATSKRAAVRTSNASGNTLTQTETTVKRKLSDRDSSGTQLSKEQADYFRNSKVRDEQGNLLVMYHGTPNGGFTKFRSGSYFTQNPDYAALYQNPGASMLSYKKGADNPQNYQVYLNIEKPFDTRNPKERRIFMQEYYRQYGTGAPLSDSGLPDWTDGIDLQEFIDDMGYDYDGLILDEGATGGYGDEVKSRGLSYVTFNPEQVKNVDNTTPTTDPDIRYSDRDPDAGKMNRILQKQNAELKDTVEYLKELVRLQGKVTDGTVYTRGSVEAAARRLMKDAGAKGDVVELRGILERCYKAMGEGSAEMTGLIDEAAQWLVEHQKNIDLEEVGASDMNVQRLNVWESFTGLIPIKTVADRNQAQVESIKRRYDQKVQDIRQRYDDQISQLKQQRAESVKEVRRQMQEKADAKQQEVKERFQRQKDDLKAAREDVQTIEREFLRIVREYDKTSKTGNAAQSKAEDLKAALEAETKKHKQDNAMWEKEFQRLSKEYEKVDRNADALQVKLDNARESAKKRVEGRKQTAIRNQLKDLNGKLNRMLTNPGKGVTAHAPVALTRAVADVCDLFAANLEQAEARRSGEYDARIDALSGKLAEKPELKYARNGIDAAERQKVRIANKEIKLGELRQRYEEIKKDGALSIYYDEHTNQLLEALDKNLRGKDIYDMTSDELQDVKDTMSSFYHSIVNANKIWLGDHNASLTETAQQWGKEINDVNVGFIRKYLNPVSRFTQWQMSPDTMFMAFSGYAKNSVGEQVQKMFAKGTERMIRVQNEYYNLFADITENPKNRKELGTLLGNPTKKKSLVDVGLKDRNGNSVQITRGMAISLYFLLGQEDSRKALVYSELGVPDLRMYYKDRSRAYGDKDLDEMFTLGRGASIFDLSKQIDDAEKSLKRGEFGGLSEEAFRNNLEDMRRQRDEMAMGEEARLLEMRNTIEEQFTPLERECIATGRKWFARSGELMADTHEEMHGFRPRLVKDYYPNHRNTDTVWTDIRDSSTAFNLENSGFLKERVPNRNAILLTDFFVEIAEQRDAIATYCGYAPAQKDFSRLWKMKLPGMSSSINGMIGAKFGKGNSGLGVSGVDYVENYIEDIAGGRKGTVGLLDFFYGAAASKSLSLNPRVAVSQLASIPTAAAAVGWKNMSMGFAKGLKTAFSKDAKIALAQKNAFFFQRYRGEGGITEMADLTQKNGLWNRISKSRAGKLLFNWCQNMDVFATSTMYAMAEEAAVSRGYQRGEAGFDDAANEIYTEIIRKTQPNYTVTERSDMLRDNRAHMKMFNMFKTQTNQNLNILMQASGKFAKMRLDFKSGRNGVTRADVTRAAKDLANAGTAVIIGGCGAFVLMRTAVNLVWAQVKCYRDDETGEVTSDKIKEGMFQEFLSSMAGMFTLGDMAYEIIHAAISRERYYGLTDSAVGAVGDAIQDVFNIVQELLDDEGWDEQEWKKNVRRPIGSVFGAFGAPAENAMKFMDAYEHWVLNIQNGSLGNYYDSATTKAQYRNRFLNAYRAGDEDTCNDILAILAVNSDEPNERRAVSQVRSGFRDSLKEKFLDEQVTEDEVRDIMVNYLDADSEDVELMIAGWKGKQETGLSLEEYQDQYLREKISTEDYIQYLTKYQGKDQEEAEEAELRLRCERDTGYAYDEIKEAYMDGEITASDAADWLRIYGNVEDADKKLKEYDFESETGYSWYDKRQCYLDSAVSKSDFKRWLMDIDGKRNTDADAYINDLDFEKENGYAYNEKLEMYVAGKITRSELKRALMEKGRMYDAEADRELVAYDYIKNHPDTALSISTAYSYTRKIDNCEYTIQSSGLTEEQFLSFREKKNACNGTDIDGDGYRDSGSVQAQILPIIDAMPISEEQKDTLWFFCGWSKRTLNKKAPWKKR